MYVPSDTEDLLKIPANVTIPAGMDTNQVIEVSFQIVDNTVGGMPDQTVELTLEFNSPSEFMNLVVIGGSGTNSKMTVVVIDDDGKTAKCAKYVHVSLQLFLTLSPTFWHCLLTLFNRNFVIVNW